MRHVEFAPDLDWSTHYSIGVDLAAPGTSDYSVEVSVDPDNPKRVNATIEKNDPVFRNTHLNQPCEEDDER